MYGYCNFYFLCVFRVFLAICYKVVLLSSSSSSLLLLLLLLLFNIYFFIIYLTHSLLEILPKTRFEARRVVFWSLSCYQELKLTTNRFTGRTLRGLLIQMQNISLRSSGMRRKQNFAFLASFFFSLAAHLVGFILVGRVFRKTRFSWRFSGQCHVVFCFFLRCP